MIIKIYRKITNFPKWLAWKIAERIWDWAYFAEPCHEFWLYHAQMWILYYSPRFDESS